VYEKYTIFKLSIAKIQFAMFNKVDSSLIEDNPKIIELFQKNQNNNVNNNQKEQSTQKFDDHTEI